MFNKEDQRRRAAEFEFVQLSKGIKKPVSNPVPAPHWPGILAFPMPPAVVKPSTKKVPKAKKLTYAVEPFTNELGQTIQPGDHIIAVSQGYNHSTKVRKGIYLGVRFTSKGKVSTVVVKVQMSGYRWVDASGEPCHYSGEGVKNEKYTYERQSSLPSKRIYPTTKP